MKVRILKQLLKRGRLLPRPSWQGRPRGMGQRRGTDLSRGRIGRHRDQDRHAERDPAPGGTHPRAEEEALETLIGGGRKPSPH